MWSDNETSEDLLGFKVHADLLIDVINDNKILPVTIGVFGDWGSGKSSILKIVNDELAGAEDSLKNDTLVLYFNGWLFEGYDDAKAALLESIIEKFEHHKTLGSKIRDEARKLIKSVKWMRAIGLGFKRVILPVASAYVTGGLSLVPHLARELSKLDGSELAKRLQGEEGENFLSQIISNREEEDSTLVREFRNDFKNLIEKSRIKKLVVIIDDLDRCTPERIIENLEAIKLFLNVERTAFIIGADPRIVRHAIEFKYRTESIENSDEPNSRNERIVNDYLEKLIQIPYNLPRLSDNEVETYMTLLFCQKELGVSFEKVLQAFNQHRASDRYGSFGFGDIRSIVTEDEQKQLSQSISLIASLSSVITEGLNGNPRQIKRFLNTFTLRSRLVQVAKLPDFKVEILAKLMVLEYSSPVLFTKIYSWQSSQNGEPKELKDMEALIEKSDLEGLRSKYPEWVQEKAMRWLKVEPKLSGIDFRDYYWISRDHLSSSISGASLISPHIRTLFKKLLDHGSGTILSHTVRQQVTQLSEPELATLYQIIEKEMLKTPENDRLHKIYIEMMAQRIPNCETAYAKVIKQIDHQKVPFSLRNELLTAKNANDSVSDIISLFRPESQIGKALKQK